MLNILLFGPPGSGKGTQSEKLSEKYNLVHVSTGELIRAEIAAKTEIGVRIADDMAAGLLASDETVIGLIGKKFEQHPEAQGFVFDGFPRTENQAHILDGMMAHKNTSIGGMIALQVEQDKLVERIRERGKTEGRPEDMNSESINKRLNIYYETTARVSKYYKAQGKLHKIDGEASIDTVFERIISAIHAF